MRRASRAIIIKDNQLLVMHRNKFGTEYDTLPGGNIELGETPEQALEREVGEETMIRFKAARLVFLEHADPLYGDQYIYLCEYVSGEPQLHPESEEIRINKLGQNLYEPAWLPLSTLPATPFKSEHIKTALLDALKNGWPDKPVEIQWH
jgi:mutator protein MutT